MHAPPPPLLIDSVTRFGPDAAGRICVGGSHAGRFATWLCARAGLRGVVLCDAGIGRDGAGVAGLADLDALGMPAAAYAHHSARIGDGADALARGVLSSVNDAARACGLLPGMAVREASTLLAAHAPPIAREPPPMRESRFNIALPAHPGLRACAMDSVSLVTPADIGAIIATGSHGGLLGGRPETAVKVAVFAALYNDAGIGMDEAGCTRLPALDARGIAGATVDAMSARIGDGRSTHADGVLSRVNTTARAYGLRGGMAAREAVLRLAAALEAGNSA